MHRGWSPQTRVFEGLSTEGGWGCCGRSFESLLGATKYTHLDCSLKMRRLPPLVPPILGGDRSSKSPKFGGLKPSGRTRKGGEIAGKLLQTTHVYLVAVGGDERSPPQETLPFCRCRSIAHETHVYLVAVGGMSDRPRRRRSRSAAAALLLTSAGAIPKTNLYQWAGFRKLGEFCQER